MWNFWGIECFHFPATKPIVKSVQICFPECGTSGLECFEKLILELVEQLFFSESATFGFECSHLLLQCMSKGLKPIQKLILVEYSSRLQKAMFSRRPKNQMGRKTTKNRSTWKLQILSSWGLNFFHVKLRGPPATILQIHLCRFGTLRKTCSASMLNLARFLNISLSWRLFIVSPSTLS